MAAWVVFIIPALLAGLFPPLANQKKSDDMARIVDRVRNSVVSIESFGGARKSSWCRIGSGFIFHEDGFVVTYYSVIAQGDSVRIRLVDGRSFRTVAIDHDAGTQIALLKISTGKHSPILIRKIESLQEGSQLFFIGNSLGVFPSVTLGTHRGKGEDGLIRLEATMPPGNCGGPVFTDSGELVGMVVGRLSEGITEKTALERTAVVPIEAISRAAESAIKRYSLGEGWIGISGIDVPMQENKIGVRVTDVVWGGPADAAMICKGDTIVGFEGRVISGVLDLANRIRTSVPNRMIEILLKRNGNPVPCPVQTGGLPASKRHRDD